MGDLGVTSPWPCGEDLEMDEMGVGMHASNQALNGKSKSREGESSLNGKLRLQKINGCL